MKRFKIIIILCMSILLIACTDESKTNPSPNQSIDTSKTNEETNNESEDEQSIKEVHEIIKNGPFYNLTADLSGAKSIAIRLEDGEAQNYSLIKINENDETEKVTFTDPTGEAVSISLTPYLIEVMGNYSFIVFINDRQSETSQTNFHIQYYQNKLIEPSNLYISMLNEYYDDDNFNFVAIHNTTGKVFSISMMARASIEEALLEPPVDENSQDSVSSASVVQFTDIAYDFLVSNDTIYMISNNPIYSDITTITLDTQINNLKFNNYKNENDTFLPQTLFNDDLIYVENNYQLNALSKDFKTVKPINLELCELFVLNTCSEVQLQQQEFKIRNAQVLNGQLYVYITSNRSSSIIVLDNQYHVTHSKLYWFDEIGTYDLNLFISHDRLYYVDDYTYLMELDPVTLSINESYILASGSYGNDAIYEYRTKDHMFFFTEQKVLRYDFNTQEMTSIGTVNDYNNEYIECLIIETPGQPGIYQNFYYETGEFITKEMDQTPTSTIIDRDLLN
jgi:hypothetical protein